MAFQNKAILNTKKMSKSNYLSPDVFVQAQNAPKPVFGWGPPRTPLAELTTLADPLVG